MAASDRDVMLWWGLLCAVAVVNIAAWCYSALAIRRRRGHISIDSYGACRLQLALSAVYVFGCAFRSAVPVFDVPRICLFNSWVSSVIVGRSVATAAELCFVAQWALMLRATGRIMDSLVTQAASRMLLPLIVIAEICSWYSVLTTSNLGHVVEESLWALSAGLFVASMIAVSSRCSGPRRSLYMGLCVAASLYMAYMLLIDVPRYWERWVADEAHGRHYLSIMRGVLDAFGRRVISYRWQDWRTEIAWMSLYFSVAVWVSISLVHAALLGARRVRSGAHEAHVAPLGTEEREKRQSRGDDPAYQA